MMSSKEVYKLENHDGNSGVLDLLTDELAEDSDQVEGRDSKEGVAVWCEECGVHNIGECFIHGGKITVQHDEALPTRACLSLPKILLLKRVKDEDPCSLEAKKGVFSKKPLEARTMFGPLEAVLSLDKPRLPTGSMEYQLITPEGIPVYFDTTDEGACNWMMFVRPANTFAQQNMAAFQKDEQIYFVTCKNIPTGTELRVWYAAAYAKAIAKRMLLPDTMEKVVKKAPPTVVNKEASPVAEKLLKTVKKEKKQAGPVRSSAKANKSKVAALLSADIKSSVEESNTDQANAQVVEDLATGSGKATRSARATKEPSMLFACHTCSTAFTTVGQLDLHVCKELGEGEEDNPGFGTRRRKGKPRKLLDNEDSPPAAKVAKSDLLKEEASAKTNEANNPDEFLVPQGPEDDTVDRDSAEQNKDILTLLPSTALIPTTAEFSTDDVENQTSVKPRRGRGRPKGSKTGGKFHLKGDTSASKRPTFTCQYCQKTFNSHEQYLVHEASHTNTLPYTCQVKDCGKSFNSKFKYQRHIMVHEKPNNFKCKFCSRTFNRVDHLKNHLLVHDSNRDTFTCKICGKSYLYKTTLTFHMAKHEAEEGESLTCLVCNKSFDNKEQLKVHVNTHNRYKPEPERNRKHRCPRCDKTFTTAKDISRHMVTHSKERRFLCEHCPQTFVRKDHLRRHYTSNHKKEFYLSQMKTNPFGCSVCLLVFKKEEFLDYHMKTVHPDGPIETEPKKDKASKYTVTVKPTGFSTSDTEHSDAAIQKESANPLVKLQKQLNKQLKSKEKKRLPQLMMKPPPGTQPPPKPIPVSLHRNEQAAGLSANPRPYAILCHTTTVQSVESQTPVYDAEEMNTELFTTAAPIKTVPFRFQNQLMSQPLAQVQANSQKHQLLQDSQQQQQQQQQQAVQDQSLLSQLQLQQQQTQLQQQQFQQQQEQQKRQQQQAQLQSLAPVVQCLPVSDMLSNLATLSQTQDMAGPPNANVFNIITVGGNNFIVGGGQVMELNKCFPMTVLKDTPLDGRQAIQQLLQTQVQPLGVKTEASCLVSSQGQLIRASVAKPDHCYATATMANPTLTQILNNPSKSQPPVLEKPSPLQGPCITDEEATRIMTQMKNAGSNSSLVNTANLSETLQSQTEVLVTQQQLQQQQQQQQQITQNQFQQQDGLQEQQQQQQLQGWPSFILTDTLDYTPVTELPVVSGDVTSMGQGDGLGTAVAGAAPTNWILQLPTVLDQPQIQQLQTQSLQGSHIMTITTTSAASDS